MHTALQSTQDKNLPSCTLQCALHCSALLTKMQFITAQQTLSLDNHCWTVLKYEAQRHTHGQVCNAQSLATGVAYGRVQMRVHYCRRGAESLKKGHNDEGIMTAPCHLSLCVGQVLALCWK